MHFDMTTLLVVHSAGFAAVAALLAFYRRYLKTYAGFDRWLSGSLLLAGGILLVLARGALPLSVSVLGGHFLVALGTLARLDGTARFLRGAGVPRPLYAGPLLYLAVMAWFTLARDDMAERTFALSLWVTFFAFANALEFLRAAPAGNPGLHRGMAACFATMGANALIRGLFVLITRDTDFLHPVHPPVHVLYFAANLVLDFACALGFLLLTSQRVEAETAAEVDRTVETLDRLHALREDTMRLGGLIPVCFDCGRVRDDAGFWNGVKGYLETRSAARFHDSLCPECAAGKQPKDGGPA